jgi:hypothetical protein
MARRRASSCPPNTEFEYCETGSVESLIDFTSNLTGVVSNLRFEPNLADTLENVVIEVRVSDG